MQGLGGYARLSKESGHLLWEVSTNFRTPAYNNNDIAFFSRADYWWMEANIFDRPDVSAELSEFVLTRLYTDGDGEIYERQQAFQERTFGTVALPLYAVVDADGKVRATFTGLTRNPGEFIAFLQRARVKTVATVPRI